MFTKIRHWLILKLAGKSPIALNLTFDGNDSSAITLPPNSWGGLIAGCTFKNFGAGQKWTRGPNWEVVLAGVG